MSFLFLDTETHNLQNFDLTQVGAYQYNAHQATFTTLVQWAFDDDDVQVWRPGDPLPEDVCEHIKAGGYVVAHNAAFDKLHWQYVLTGEYGWPELSSKQVLCTMVQCQAHALPAGLAHLSRIMRLEKKKLHARSYVHPQLSIVQAYLDGPPTDPRDIQLMEDYGVQDVEAMREIWGKTRTLSKDEWLGYWNNEAINDRGVPVDVELAKLCADVGARLSKVCEYTFHEITGFSVNQTQAISAWLADAAHSTQALELMTVSVEKNGEVIKKVKIDEDHRNHALACDDLPEHVRRALEVLNVAKSSTAKKYSKVADLAIDGRVHGAYNFNGAGQTGRYSSRGMQLHNMYRNCYDEEQTERARERLVDFLFEHDMTFDKLTRHYLGISQDLKSLIRPVIAAPEGKLLTWGDWSGIEARLCPWMANSRGSQRVLDLFNAGEDPYVHDAADVFSVDVSDVTKEQRQMGKVIHLALQYNGGVGALFQMAAGYGITLAPDDAKAAVERWKKANAWVKGYADYLWASAKKARNAPGIRVDAGRVQYYFAENILGGSLLCFLPCGRPLCYPGARFKMEYDKERDWNREVLALMGGGTLWSGSLVNHVTQGTAASVLRHAIDLDADDRQLVVAHTHDELITEDLEDNAGETKEYLAQIMASLPPWLDGLDIPVDIGQGHRYGK